MPIICSSEGTAVSNYNIDLFKQPGIIYNNQVDGPVCLNPAQNIADRPALPFFKAYVRAAYTYPNDNKANVSNLKSNVVSYYIGTSCSAPLRQLVERRNPIDIRIRNNESRAEITYGSSPLTLPLAYRFAYHLYSP